MATIHVYIAFQDLNLNATQRGRVFDAVEAFYREHQVPSNQPHEILHPPGGRRSLDGRIAIFEALFDDAHLSVASFKRFLADEFGRDPGEIADARGDQTFAARVSPFWTFSFNATNYFRVGVFGGLGATRAQSQAEINAYLEANRELWEAEVG